MPSGDRIRPGSAFTRTRRSHPLIRAGATYLAGRFAELGTDAQVEELTEADVTRVRALCAAAGFPHIDPENVTRIGSARQLYHFDTQHAGSY